MTVGELRKLITGLPDEFEVVAYSTARSAYYTYSPVDCGDVCEYINEYPGCGLIRDKYFYEDLHQPDDDQPPTTFKPNALVLWPMN